LLAAVPLKKLSVCVDVKLVACSRIIILSRIGIISFIGILILSCIGILSYIGIHAMFTVRRLRVEGKSKGCATTTLSIFLMENLFTETITTK